MSNNEKINNAIQALKMGVQDALDSSWVTLDYDHELPLEEKIVEVRNASAKVAELQAGFRAVARLLKNREATLKEQWSTAYRMALASAVVAAARDAEGRKARATNKANEEYGDKIDKLSKQVTTVDQQLAMLEAAYKDLNHARSDLTNLVRLRVAQIRLEL